MALVVWCPQCQQGNMMACPHTYTVGMGCQILESLFEDIKINQIGFTKNGRQTLNDQEHIFVENLIDDEKAIFNELPLDKKLELHQKKYFSKY